MGAGIPLPALAIQPPPQQANPAESYVRLASLLGQQRLQQQQIQGGQLENQQRQMQIQAAQRKTTRGRRLPPNVLQRRSENAQRHAE